MGNLKAGEISYMAASSTHCIVPTDVKRNCMTKYPVLRGKVILKELMKATKAVCGISLFCCSLADNTCSCPVLPATFSMMAALLSR